MSELEYIDTVLSILDKGKSISTSDLVEILETSRLYLQGRKKALTPERTRLQLLPGSDFKETLAKAKELLGEYGFVDFRFNGVELTVTPYTNDALLKEHYKRSLDADS